jgi:hypothetical protein
LATSTFATCFVWNIGARDGTVAELAGGTCIPIRPGYFVFSSLTEGSAVSINFARLCLASWISSAVGLAMATALGTGAESVAWLWANSLPSIALKSRRAAKLHNSAGAF